MLQVAGDVFGDGRLLMRRHCHFMHALARLLRLTQDRLEHVARFACLVEATCNLWRCLTHRCHGRFGIGLDADDHGADLAGCLRRPFRKLAHFIGNDGKPASLLTCACGFDGGVESQEIGLFGDLLDRGGDAADLA
ncbi:MAG: hypothetical protein AW12_02008 [Candidatus Accumulibacter sp. BA-94]|nr:MAG: hypothetical protein AW12_02008 [Candidatus Accumulibacter sp. BA-94]